MREYETPTMSAQEELTDLLLDFIIVAARLAQKLNRAMRVKKNTEGGKHHGQNQRLGNADQRSAHSGGNNQ